MVGWLAGALTHSEDKEVSDESWETYQKRNRSAVVDNVCGQVRLLAHCSLSSPAQPLYLSLTTLTHPLELRAWIVLRS